ncbi:MAG: LPS biosynthesis choline kinase, partial [Rhizobiaceae bacterium]
MAAIDEAGVREAIGAIAVLTGARGTVARLGGMTNRVYRVGAFCLRIPGDGTSEYINRAHEAVAAREAARAGVSPQVLHFDEHTGVMVTRFIENAATMSPQGFAATEGAVER